MFSKKLNHLVVLVCGIIFTVSIITACDKDNDDNAKTEVIMKRLTHFTISSNRSEDDSNTYYYEYDELGRLAAINSYETLKFSYIGHIGVTIFCKCLFNLLICSALPNKP